MRPDIANIACPFLIWLVSIEITFQQVWHNVELVIAICCDLVFARSDHAYAVLAHQAADATMADTQADFFQFSSHSWAATLGALLRNTLPCSAYLPRLRCDCSLIGANVTRSDRCLRPAGRLQHARKPRAH